MVKYVKVYDDKMSRVIEYKEVEDEYEEEEGIEQLCTKEEYHMEKFSIDQKKLKQFEYQKSKVIHHLAIKERAEATELIVEVVKKQFAIRTTMSDDKPEMWVYDEGIYIPQGETRIRQICRYILGKAHTNALASQVVEKIRTDTYIKTDFFFNSQNEEPYIIPVENGILDLKNKTLSEFTDKKFFFNKINARYQPGKDCPEIKKFIGQILNKEEDIKAIQELIGFCLIREYKYEKGFMLYGAQGRNGKGKLLELIKRFVGLENISSIGLQEIETSPFCIGNLHNKLVNICGDISPEALKNTGKYKELTGRDPQQADRKFKERIQFTNYAKMIFSCNELPPVYTTSDAFWMRWVLITFPNRFLPKKEFSSLSEEEKKNSKLQDPDIIMKITSEDEFSGFLNYAIEGLERLDKQLDFSAKETARELSREWKRQSNSVSAFIEDMIKESYDDYITKNIFMKEYQTYCKKNRLSLMSNKTIAITMKEELGLSSEDKLYIDGGQIRVWKRITWK